jgi:NADH:ubiquinone oxidoreductase subunit 3 (subunit A)
MTVFGLCSATVNDEGAQRLNVIYVIVLYAFLVINMAVSVLVYWRDSSKKTKIIVLIIFEVAIHIGFIIVFLYWLNGKTF